MEKIASIGETTNKYLLGTTPLARAMLTVRNIQSTEARSDKSLKLHFVGKEVFCFFTQPELS